MRRAPEPLIPLRLFRDRTIVIAVLASIAVGVAMFGTTVFLTQYMQIARAKSPTESGLLTIPMVGGLLISSIVVGRRVTRTGVYKPYMVAGATLLTLGLFLMGTLDETTHLGILAVFMVILGSGIGMLMQNLVLVVQNSLQLGGHRRGLGARGLHALARRRRGRLGARRAARPPRERRRSRPG